MKQSNRKPYTGGPLNELNGKAGISAPNRSVPVSRLVKAHNPKSAEELERLIAVHVDGKCKCGVVSRGTVQDFGRNLYHAQKKYWGEYRFSLQQCIQWEYDLFILQTLKGKTMEHECVAQLNNILGEQFDVKFTSRYIDEEIRVDLEICKENQIVAGIQVKPSSYNQVRKNVHTFNELANQKFGRPVFFAFYDYDSEKFLNLEVVKSEILKLFMEQL